MNVKPLVLSVAAVFALAACQQEAPPAPPAEPAGETAPAETAAPEPAAEAPASFADRLAATIDGEHRSEANRARNAWRNPAQTLAFFGFDSGQTVVEITPGGGWYAEILAPVLKGNGTYVGAIIDPTSVENERAQTYYSESNQKLRDFFAAAPEHFDEARLVEFSLAEPSFGEPGSADLVLTFRNVHNWMGGGHAEGMFRGFFEVLKPGGVLGVVEHRAASGAEVDPQSGYVAQQAVIDLASAAGFALVEASEINANPADTKDHPNGVWTLPPSRRTPEGEDPAKYDAIGESDRMTLKFVKPGAPADNAGQ